MVIPSDFRIETVPPGRRVPLYKTINETIFRYVYAPYHHEKGNMNEVEWETYLNLVDFFLVEPEYQLDGIIYESVLNYIFFKSGLDQKMGTKVKKQC